MKKRWLTLLLAFAVVLLAGAATPGDAPPGAEAAALTPEEIYTGAASAVVYIRAMRDDGTLKSAGSGFITTADGLTLTAAHVLKNAASVRVVLPEGTELASVPVVYCDEDRDIALLQLPERAEDWQFIPFSAAAPAYGAAVCVIGYPLKTAKIIQEGIVCAPEARVNGQNLLLISAEISSGMSGGPVLGADGSAVGLCSGTVRTMNGVHVSPTTEQINDALASLHKEAMS